MIIPAKNLRQWKKVVADIGITAFAESTGKNFRTVKRALDSGECSDDVFLACHKSATKRLAKVKKLVSVTIDDNN